MITVRNLGCALNRVRRLRLSSLRIPDRGIFQVHGDNGTGKTTLIRCIAGIRMDWTGSIALDNRSIRGMSRRAIAGVLSYLPQSSPPDVVIGVEEYIRQGLYAASSDCLDEVVGALDLRHFLRRNYAKLSGGEKQLVRIARALSPSVRYSLLDEPETFLSCSNRLRFYRLVRRLSRDRSVVIVTHSPSAWQSGIHNLLEL